MSSKLAWIMGLKEAHVQLTFILCIKGILIEMIILSCLLLFVHQVVEVFSNGNLEEFPVPSFFHAWLYASQLSSALEYLEAKNILHSSVIGSFVYISSPDKVHGMLIQQDMSSDMRYINFFKNMM